MVWTRWPSRTGSRWVAASSAPDEGVGNGRGPRPDAARQIRWSTRVGLTPRCSALNTAVKRRLIPYNPANHIELAPENHRRPRPWTAEQCQEFLACTADDRLANLYQLMIVTGMRRGETVGLRWEDVDLDDEFLFVIQQITEVNGRSVVSTPKTKKGQRLVQIDRDTSTMLRRHRVSTAREN